MSAPANFNDSRPMIDVNDTAMLLIDHQSGLFQTVGDMPMPELRARAAALAKMASLAGLPVFTTASVPQGPNGPLIPEIHENAPHAQYIARKGEINAWDNPDFVAAVKATGRKTLIIAGTITSVCMAFPSIAAVADGYRVFAVIDASGTYSKMAQEITLARVVQAGVVPMDTAAVASELQRSWNRPDAAEWAEVYTKIFPAYAGDAAPQQIAVAAQHFSGQQESAEAQPENMRMGENERDHDFFRSPEPSLISSLIPAMEPIRLLASSGIITTLLLLAEPIFCSASVYFWATK